jgi:cation transport ATPase
MMLLISLAISVAFIASVLSLFGIAELEFWWELAGLIVVMLLGHWQEMRAPALARADIGIAIGAVLMSLSTIVVALNAQLLRHVELAPAPTDEFHTHEPATTPSHAMH